MVNSRSIDDLRADVRVNCCLLLTMCSCRGLDVLITGTYRDEEYQKYCYLNGTANTPLVGPHHFGLAFDFCKNVKGHEYDDLNFFKEVADLAKPMGFIWGGDWKKFKDRPHLEWRGNPQCTDTLLRRGVMPSQMPPYSKDIAPEKKKPILPLWGADSWEYVTEHNIMDDSRPMEPVTRLELAVVIKRIMERD